MEGKKDQGDEKILNAIIIACVVGITIILGLIYYNSLNEIGFSELYFNDYSKEITDGKISFNYAIANHEGVDTTYEVTCRKNDILLGKERIFIETDGKKSFEKSFDSENGTYKISVEFVNNNQTYEIHFWTQTEEEYM